MGITDKHHCQSIREYINSRDESRRNLLSSCLSSFSCPKNPDIERFLKKSAVEFTKKQQSVTYFVFTNDDLHMFVGYFALTVKPFTIGLNNIPSNTWRRKIERVARFNENTQKYSAAGYLIAQMGKNFTDGANEMITGNELLEIALDMVYSIQDMAGGMITFLEAENNEKLINFYQQNGFHLISNPNTPREELIQFFRML